jgi:hypothetical protein
MLNPSRADATRDDPTLRRCLGFARAWGYGALDVVNLFAWRTSNPAALRHVPDPVGPDNDRTLVEVAHRADLVVAAWGNHGVIANRHQVVCSLLRSTPLFCLDVTQQGQPRHPLYIPCAATPCLF